MTDIFIGTFIVHKTDFVGGTDDCLDSVDGALLKDGWTGSVYKDVGGYICKVDYIVDADSGETESVPDVIAPDSNAGTKRWIRSSAAIVTGATEPTSPFTGLIWEET